MAEVKLEHIYKVYPNGTKAVSDFTMDIKDNEFIVFVGPSGCGKSTTLRMIAGLEDITAGELYIDGKIMNEVEPKDRDIAMVFQNYALYPHMTVYDNMAFGLKLRHVPSNVVHEKVLWAANILGLTDYLDRTPRAMSGGQRQRVALGRAILRNPKVMLLDEPLSNLDAKLRSQMRSEIAKLHQQLKTTFIYVTHDQVEAMTLGTRVVVMKQGRIQQIDTPKNLYDYPDNKFVAGFMGTPQMNFFEGKLAKKDDQVEITLVGASDKLYVPIEKLNKINPYYLNGIDDIIFGCRCENIALDLTKKAANSIEFKVSHFEELGNETLIYGSIKDEERTLGDNKYSCIVKCPNDMGLKVGDVTRIVFDLTKAHFFDKKTELNLMPRSPEVNHIVCESEGEILSLLEQSLKLPSAIKLGEFTGEAIVPVDAITIKDDGELSGRLSRVENVNGTYLAHIHTGHRVIFAKVKDDSLKPGEIHFSINMEKLSFLDENRKVVYSSVGNKDEIKGRFLNYKNAIAFKNDPSFADEESSRIAKVETSYDEKIAELKKDYETSLSAIDESKLMGVKKKNYAEISKNSEDLKEKNTKAREFYHSEKTRIKAEHKKKIGEINREIDENYDKKKREEEVSYRKFMKSNKDSDARSKSRQAHFEFRDNLPKEKANDLGLKINSENLNFDTLIGANKALYKRNKATYKEEFKQLKKELDHQSNPKFYLSKEYRAAYKKLIKEKADAIRKVEQIYFFNLNGYIVRIPDQIASKVIQGLGVKSFTKEFIVEFPHSSYVIGREGFSVEVVENLDYGDHYLVKTKYEDALKKERYLYVNSDKKAPIGEKIKLKLDVGASSIIEAGMDIKLY
jgi:multiple sugar transport system ATP-binding protein